MNSWRYLWGCSQWGEQAELGSVELDVFLVAKYLARERVRARVAVQAVQRG